MTIFSLTPNINDQPLYEDEREAFENFPVIFLEPNAWQSLYDRYYPGQPVNEQIIQEIRKMLKAGTGCGQGSVSKDILKECHLHENSVYATGTNVKLFIVLTYNPPTFASGEELKKMNESMVKALEEGRYSVHTGN